jgi:hypothetical protein
VYKKFNVNINKGVNMKSSRRDLLKKTAFIVPTLMTFNMSQVSACVSGGQVDASGYEPKGPDKGPKPPKPPKPPKLPKPPKGHGGGHGSH